MSTAAESLHPLLYAHVLVVAVVVSLRLTCSRLRSCRTPTGLSARRRIPTTGTRSRPTCPKSTSSWSCSRAEGANPALYPGRHNVSRTHVVCRVCHVVLRSANTTHVEMASFHSNTMSEHTVRSKLSRTFDNEHWPTVCVSANCTTALTVWRSGHNFVPSHPPAEDEEYDNADEDYCTPFSHHLPRDLYI